MIFATDFDGTLCENKFPDIGKPNIKLINYLIAERKSGNEVILYTMREGYILDKAIEWCKNYGLKFDSVNDNIPRMKEFYKNNPRKIFANVYIDDHNLKGEIADELPYMGEAIENPADESDNAMPYTRKLELTLFSVIRDRLVTEFKDKGAPELNNLAYELMQKTMYDAGGVDWEKAEESYIMGENMYYGLKGGKKHDE